MHAALTGESNFIALVLFRKNSRFVHAVKRNDRACPTGQRRDHCRCRTQYVDHHDHLSGGSHWNAAADPNVLLLAFAGLMLVAAYGMWRRVHNAPPSVGHSVGAAAATVVMPRRIDTNMVVKVIVAGSVVGFLTGFFGVGGGFVIVPGLVLALGFTMPEAIGTSLLVITINSVVALSTRLQTGSIEWGTVVPFSVASLLGVIVGSRLASTRDSSSLQRWFVALLVIVAGYTAVHSGLALR